MRNWIWLLLQSIFSKYNVSSTKIFLFSPTSLNLRKSQKVFFSTFYRKFLRNWIWLLFQSIFSRTKVLHFRFIFARGKESERKPSHLYTYPLIHEREMWKNIELMRLIETRLLACAAKLLAGAVGIHGISNERARGREGTNCADISDSRDKVGT